jgi:hypothetical protein
MITRTRTVLTLAAVAMAIVGLTIPSANAKNIVEEQFIYEPPEANIFFCTFQKLLFCG